MIFTVKYRGADGAPVSEAVEAASRADCLAKMKARGVSVLGVKEGNFAGKPRKTRDSRASMDPRNSRASSTSRASRKTITATIIAVVAVAAILGIGIWWMMSRDKAQPSSEPEIPKKVALPKEVKPAAAPKPEAVTNSSGFHGSDGGVPVSATNEVLKYKGVEIVRSTAQTNTDGTVIERIFTADGKSHRITHLPPRVFTNPCDEYLAAILTVPKNAPMAPLPDLSHENLEEQFKEAIKTPIKVLPEDSDEVKEAKMLVIAAREEMATLLKNGYKFHEVLMEQQKIAAENLDVRAKVIREFNEIVKSGDSESAREYVRKMNVALQQMGIEGLKLPASMRNPEEEKGKDAK